ncbi:hypothetical protein HDU97_000637, partial [Phlyctochytrium planicorne]
TAFHTGDTTIQSITLFKSQDQAPVYNQATFVIEAALPSTTPELSFWFTCTKDDEAPQYDSNYGQNYRFPLGGAIVDFEAGYTHGVKGQIKAGLPVVIAYNETRAPCHKPQFDVTESVTAFWFNTGSTVVNQATVYHAYYNYRMGPAYVHTPAIIESAQAGELQIYFGCQTSDGSAWDSNLGKNWRFNVAA